MAYATTTELADYLGVQEADLPDDADRLLDRASETIDYYTLNRIDESVTSEADAAKKATMAQYEWWSQFDEFMTSNFLSSVSIGPYSAGISPSEGGSTIPDLAPRAKRYLFLEGLMYKGVEVR